MKEKIFISYSGVWKNNYVVPLVERLGGNTVVVDDYDFESGEEIWAEIQRNIEDCKYFLFLISEEALKKGGWVDREIGKVGQLVLNGEVKFWPVIIDDKVDWDHENIKPWIKKQYLVHKIPTPKVLARLINNKLRKEIIAGNQFLKEKNKLFVGRDDDMKRLKAKFSDARTNERNIKPTTLFVSGIKYLGRKRFIKEFIVKEVTQVANITDIIVISLSSTDNGWSLAQQLNELIGDYTPESLNSQSSDEVKLNSIIVEMMLKLRENKEVIVIEDDGALVKRNGSIAHWFLDLIKNTKLQKEFYWYICSRFSPRSDINQIFPQVISIKLNEISKEWLIRLYKEYAQISEITYDDYHAEQYVDQAKGFPRPIYQIVDALKDGNNNARLFKKGLNNWEKLVSDNYALVIQNITADIPESIGTLQVLAKTPLLSLDNLEEICGPECQEYIDVFEASGIVQYIGRSNSIVFLHSGLSDYIRRKYPNLSTSLRQKFETFTKEKIQNLKTEEDFSGYLHGKIEKIKANKTSIPEEDLIPSLVLHIITEYYYQHDNDSVIILADQILQGYKGKYMDIARPLRYWLCSALCRKGDKRLITEVQKFDSDSYSYNFLMGFYHRHRRDIEMERAYKLAKDFYEKAYAITYRNDSEYDDAKLLHELWIVKYTLDEPDAGAFAKKCYERRPSNSFHIEAYFRSEAKSSRSDKALLRKLIEEMYVSGDSHKRIIAQTMEAELNYLNHLDLNKLKENIRYILDSGIDYSFRSYPLRIFKEICKRRESLSIYTELKKNYPNIKDTDLLLMPD